MTTSPKGSAESPPFSATPTDRPATVTNSPLSVDAVVAAAVRLSGCQTDRGLIWWAEQRPDEGGRTQICRQLAAGTVVDVLPEGFSARSKVHEYGGGAWWVHEGVVFFVNDADQRIWRLSSGSEPAPITPESSGSVHDRFADGVVSGDGAWIYCVRERHVSGAGPANEIVAVPSFGERDPIVLVSGPDFVAAPRLSPDGRQLVWIQWDHPHLPWSSTELWRSGVDVRADGPSLTSTRRIAGHCGSKDAGESLVEPHFDTAGRLHAVSDRSGAWSLFRWADDSNGERNGEFELVAPMPADPESGLPAETSGPMWNLGMSSVVHLPDGTIALTVTRSGTTTLGLIEPGESVVRVLDVGCSALSQLAVVGAGLAFRSGRTLAAIGAAPTVEPRVIAIDLGTEAPAPGAPRVSEVRAARDLPMAAGDIVVPRHVTISVGDRSTHALVYLPHTDEPPALVVNVHGGPTAAARCELRLDTQFWTSRGIAVADVNYAGSTGYGRAYRQSLDGAWGVADVEDCVAMARHLADQGLVDPERLVIRGGSAGGFTALAAITEHAVFSGALVRYGVTDLIALAEDTHDFESRYLDGLVGPLPEARLVYEERSPLARVGQIADGVRVLVLQGTEDRVVPQAQADALVARLAEHGVAHAYVLFEGESHGFRTADAQRRALEAELNMVLELT